MGLCELQLLILHTLIMRKMDAKYPDAKVNTNVYFNAGFLCA